MKLKLIPAAIAVSVLSASLSAAANTWYVSTSGQDSNPCTSQQPCATITHAATLARPGETVLVAPGTYVGYVNTQASGTASAYITYLSQERWGAVLVQDPAHSVWGNYGSYVVIDGFDVVGHCPPGAATCGVNGIYTQGDDTIIQHNRVHGILPESCSTLGGSGINLNSLNDQVIGNYIYQNGSRGCKYVHGIYFEKPNGLAEENVVFQNGGYGIQEYHQASNITSSNNTIFHNTCGGIYVGNDGTGWPAVNNHSFTDNNIVFDNGTWSDCVVQQNGQSVAVGYGIHEAGATGTCNVYRNNLAYQNFTADIALHTGSSSGNLTSASPEFFNYTGGPDGNYVPLPGSPAISAGLTTDSACSVSTKILPTDFNGNSRSDPLGNGMTLGAYQPKY